MEILKDEGGQGAAEYILLFGGVIVIAVAALLIYRAYFTTNTGSKASTDISTVRSSVPLKTKLKKKWNYMLMDEKAQISAEMILIMGALLVLVIVAGGFIFNISQQIAT